MGTGTLANFGSAIKAAPVMPKAPPAPTNMDWLRYANAGATRNLPLSDKLTSAMSFLPEMGIEMEVYSGGQPHKGSGKPRIGSVRHDGGMAGDVRFYKDGRLLDFTDPKDQPIFAEIVRRGREAGLTGFGAGVDYMGANSMHIGYGTPAVWGANGKSANAPEWLRTAYYGATPPTADPRVGEAMYAGTGPSVTRDTIADNKPAPDYSLFAELAPQKSEREQLLEMLAETGKEMQGEQQQPAQQVVAQPTERNNFKREGDQLENYMRLFEMLRASV